MTEEQSLFTEEIYTNVISEINDFFDYILESFIQLNGDSDFDPSVMSTEQYILLSEMSDFSDELQSKILSDVEKYKEYLLESVDGISYFDFVKSINNFTKTHSSADDLIQLYKPKIQSLNIFHKKWIERVSNISTLKELENRLNVEVQDIKAAKLAVESNATDEIYKNLSERYEDEYELNNEYFRNSLIVAVCCTILSIAYTFNTAIADINWAVFISVKILIVAVGITLCTLFLRRSAHAKKLHEKAYQIHVEINAYPLFIRSLEKSDQQEITKELALRYFGNDIDQTQNDKIGDLMQDQLSAGTELIKASAELVKAKQGNGEG